MKETQLKSLIDKLNKNKTGGLIHLRPLSSNVDFAKVWDEKPKPSDSLSNADGPSNFYFIKNKAGLYVALVLDMTHNLHWFVLKKHRGHGYLTTEMKNIILFHLFQDREEQRITIDEDSARTEANIKASENVAFKLGFIKVDNNEYILTKDKYHTDTYIYGENTELIEQRFEELKKQLNFLGRSLWLIQTEVLMKLGDTEYSEDLFELVKEIRKQPCRLDNEWFKNKED